MRKREFYNVDLSTGIISHRTVTKKESGRKWSDMRYKKQKVREKLCEELHDLCVVLIGFVTLITFIVILMDLLPF